MCPVPYKAGFFFFGCSVIQGFKNIQTRLMRMHERTDTHTQQFTDNLSQIRHTGGRNTDTSHQACKIIHLNEDSVQIHSLRNHELPMWRDAIVESVTYTKYQLLF